MRAPNRSRSCRWIRETAFGGCEGSSSVLYHLATASLDRQHSPATAAFALTIWATLIVVLWLLPAIAASRRTPGVRLTREGV